MKSKVSDEFHYDFSTLIDLPKRDKMGSLINYLNKQQLTMTENHLKLIYL